MVEKRKSIIPTFSNDSERDFESDPNYCSENKEPPYQHAFKTYKLGGKERDFCEYCGIED